MNMKFFLEFMKNPVKLSTAIPTKAAAGKKMAELAGVSTANIIVEIGAAHGNVTREILKLMQPNAKLYSVEVVDGLYEELKKISDPRFTAIHGDVRFLQAILKEHGVLQADCIVSTLPLATMPRAAKYFIAEMKKVSTGPIVQIQYSRTIDKFFRKHFQNVHITEFTDNMPTVYFYTLR